MDPEITDTAEPAEASEPQSVQDAAPEPLAEFTEAIAEARRLNEQLLRTDEPDPSTLANYQHLRQRCLQLHDELMSGPLQAAVSGYRPRALPER
ncbi:MAG: hypothetical protein F4Y45_04050 [Acidobacteria bacterium]|nr:hypothetical protein [Acidobacteriota bacterium]